MTKDKCEAKIFQLMECIRNAYEEYRGLCDYGGLSIYIGKDGMFCFNQYWDKDNKKPIDIRFVKETQ